jgi:hypothetical protein
MILPLLMAQNPLNVPETTYDRIWVELVEISAPSPSGDVNAYVRLRRFGIRDGEVVTDPESFRLEVSDILASTDPDLEAVVTGIMNYIAKVGAAEGIIQGQS